MRITEETFRKLADLIASLAGIELAENRELMLVNRISARLHELQLKSFEEYYRFVTSANAEAERANLIDSITTHFTSFFRDAGQFNHLRTELVRAFAEGNRKIRLWSAACSSGEEPYSMAIVALEAAAEVGIHDPHIRILASDVSNRILQVAHDGWFAESATKKLTAEQQSYFDSERVTCPTTGNSLVRANRKLRELMIFRNINLCDQPLRVPEEIDVIFCRNVLLYFNVATQKKILNAVTAKMKKGGLLYVGASEQVRPHLPGLEYERVSVFRKPNEVAKNEHFAIQGVEAMNAAESNRNVNQSQMVE